MKKLVVLLVCITMSFVASAQNLLYLAYESESAVTIVAGKFEVSGTEFTLSANQSYSPGILPANGNVYIYLDFSASVAAVPVFIDSTTAPAWNDTKQGWYIGDDRCIGNVWVNNSGGIDANDWDQKDGRGLTAEQNRMLATAYNHSIQAQGGSSVGGGSAGPTGSVIIWMMPSAPVGYLECDGRTLNKTEYADLFAVLGYAYGGSGDTFNLPDMRGEFLRGWDHGKGVDHDREIGSNQNHSQIALRANHKDRMSVTPTHSTNGQNSYQTFGSGTGVNTGGNNNGYYGVRGELPDGGIYPRNISVMYCIKF